MRGNVVATAAPAAAASTPVVGRGGGSADVDGWNDGLDGGAETHGLSPHCRDILRLIKY